MPGIEPRRSYTSRGLAFAPLGLVALVIGGLELPSDWQKPRGSVWAWPVVAILIGMVTLATYRLIGMLSDEAEATLPAAHRTIVAVAFLMSLGGSVLILVLIEALR